MLEIPIAYAFSAGMVATVNPCGFVMLPAYIAYQLGLGDEAVHPLRRAAKGMAMGLVATLGFVVLFGTVGAVIAAGGRVLIRLFPYGGLAIGVGLITLGAYLLITRKHLGLLFASRIQGPQTPRGVSQFFLFGIAYALASLSCTLPIFLVVVGSALAVGGFLPGFVQFISYALGMGLVLVVVTMSVVFFKTAVSNALRAFMPYVERVGNLALMAAGAYLVYYWTLGTGGALLFS
ncbi:MAG: cytochrome c biogenesis protein CcdA [Chloroflexi bacterium]|nr:cytochrome c biogenesis protein CcdA [Chloroflexota bacterium]MBI4198625.1 cytochrome c biogenesis protein CcdA [Chloroflexota bacterium]